MVRDAAQLAWIVNLGCIDLNPHPVRADDLDHPDELRVDLDPVPGVGWGQILEVALATREVLAGVRPHGVAQDVGVPRRSTSTRGSSDGGRSRRSGVRRSRSRARSNGGSRTSRRASGGRRSATACSSTTTRTRRTAPSRRRTRYGRPGRAGYRRRSPGTRCRAATRTRSRSRRSRAVRSATATPGPGSTTPRARWSRSWSYRRSTRPRGSPTLRGRPSTRSRRTSRRGSSPRSSRGGPPTPEGIVPPPAPGKTAAARPDGGARRCR